MTPDEAPAVPLASSGGWVSRVAQVLAISLGAYHLYAAQFGPPVAMVHRAIHLGGILLLGYLLLAVRPNCVGRARLGLIATGALGAATSLYLIVDYSGLVVRVGAPTRLDLILATMSVVVVMDFARRTYGWPLVATAALALAYGLAGPLVPGFLAHRGYAPAEILEFLYTTTEGVFGIPIQVSASYIVVFIIFAAFLQRSGLVGLFNDLAYAVAGRARGGVAKVAVISSALMGTINGSALANVTTIGSVTIPMMKRAGFEPHYAAGVEATASMGGQIMPPVMGVAAFLMAERLGIPYARVALAAVIPALLYFLATGLQIHFHAGRQGVDAGTEGPQRSVVAILRSEGYLLAPVGVLLALMIVGYSPLYAAVASIGASLALSWVASLAVAWTRGGQVWRIFSAEVDARGASPRGILASLETGVRNTVGVASACAVVGIIIGVVILTGTGLKLSSGIVAAAGGHLIPTLFLTMLACFVLGMGLPTIPTYIITSTMAAPALVNLGVDGLAADFFVMYFGVLANLTPPVALAAYAAAGIAGADPFKTCVAAIRLSVAGFIVPFVFVYSPIMLGVGFTLWATIQVTISATIGVMALAAAMEGYFLRETAWYERLLLIAAAVDLIIPGMVSDLAGAGLLLAVVVSQKARKPLHAPLSSFEPTGSRQR